MTQIRILLEGRPGSGKTTVARRLVDFLTDAEIAVTGFTTEEIRESGRRVGFSIETVSGDRGILAHTDFSGQPRVGKYGVDIETFERLALPALYAAERSVVVVDELGKMELASERFCNEVTKLFHRSVAVVATVHAFRHPFTDRLKVRADIEVIRLSPMNRRTLPEILTARLTG